MAWHLHDGTEAMYQDPMGRRTPVMVIRVHNSMATVEYASGNTGRLSLKRLRCPTSIEYRDLFDPVGDGWTIRQKFGITHNGMPAFFDTIKSIMEPPHPERHP